MLRPVRLFPRYRQVYCLLELGRRPEGLKLAKKLCQDYAGSRQDLQLGMLAELRDLVE